MAKKKKDPAVNALAREGGLARARTLTPEQRKQIAQKAANARWARDREVHDGVSMTHFNLVSKLERRNDSSVQIVSDVEMSAYDQIWKRVQSHTINSTCPCDECVDAVVASVRDRYLTVLAKIDREEKLEKEEVALFRFLTGEKATRWTRIYREQCKARLAPR
jgi:hypothetical protein